MDFSIKINPNPWTQLKQEHSRIGMHTESQIAYSFQIYNLLVAFGLRLD